MDNFAIWQCVKLGRNNRGTLIGKTGCGKTTLAKFLIEDNQKPYSVTWNPKGSDAVLSWKQKHVYTLGELYECEDNRIIYTPNPFDAESETNQENLFYWIYERKYTRFYIDEATSICYPMNKSPRHL